jgi:transposase
VHQVQVPWAREGSGFTLLMEALMMVLSAEMPVDAMADLLGEHDTRLWRVLMHYVEQAHAKSDWSSVRRIAVDETSARRGHRYVTTVLDAENSRLLLMVEGRSAETLGAFAKALREHGPARAVGLQNRLLASDARCVARSYRPARSAQRCPGWPASRDQYGALKQFERERRKQHRRGGELGSRKLCHRRKSRVNHA